MPLSFAFAQPAADVQMTVEEKDGKTRTAYFVWPFESTGDELKADIDNFIKEIVDQAKPYQPAEQ